MERDPLGSAMVATTLLSDTSMTDTVPSISELTNALFPSEENAASRGRLPTGIFATTSPVDVSITVTSWSVSPVT